MLVRSPLYKATFNNSLVCTDLWRPVALPSAGTLPFVQSLICDLDQKGSRYGYQAMPSYPNATYVIYTSSHHYNIIYMYVCSVNDVYSLLDEFGSLNGTLDTFCSTIHSLSDTTSCLTATVPPECQQGQLVYGLVTSQ